MSGSDCEMPDDHSFGDPGGGELRENPSGSARPRSRRSYQPESESHETDGLIKRQKLGHVVQNKGAIVQNNVPVSNAYETLNDDTNEHELVRTGRSQVEGNKGLKSQSEKVPPITVTDISMTNLIKHMKVSADSPVRDSGDIRYRLTRNGIKILVNSVDDFKKVRDYLLHSKIRFFSHPLDEEKTIKYVMYGFYEIGVNELKQIFYDLELFPTQVSMLNINKKRYDGQCIYMLQFRLDQNVSLERLRTVRQIDGVCVRFDKYLRNQSGLTQCSNCLRFSHGARNCFLSPRCIRCGEEHASASCDKLIIPRDPKSTIPPAQVRCANCGGRHTANFEKCPERQKYLAARQTARTSLQGRLQGHAQRRTDPPNSHNNYDSRSRPNHGLRSQGQPTYANVLKNSNEGLYTPSECYQIFKRFLNEILSCKTKAQQIDVIARITLDCVGINDCP